MHWSVGEVKRGVGRGQGCSQQKIEGGANFVTFESDVNYS